MNTTSKNFQKYVNEYIKKYNWDFNSNGGSLEPYVGLKYFGEKVFAYIDYERDIIHIPDLTEKDILKIVSYNFKTKKRLLEQWKCSQIIEVNITNEVLFPDYIKLLELACKKINNRF